MTQLFFPSGLDTKNQQMYCYVNRSSKVAIIRILGLVDRHCERVVFPGEKFLFEADDNCKLEINQQSDRGIIRDIVLCSELTNL